MNEPISSQRGEEGIDKLQTQYFEGKDELLDLCLRYDLAPDDLNLMMMGRKVRSSDDRIRMIRLIIRLNDMEKILGPGRVDRSLFAADESHYSNSGFFTNTLN